MTTFEPYQSSFLFWYLWGGEKDKPNPIISFSSNFPLPCFYWPFVTTLPLEDLNPRLVFWPSGELFEYEGGQKPNLTDGS